MRDTAVHSKLDHCAAVSQPQQDSSPWKDQHVPSWSQALLQHVRSLLPLHHFALLLLFSSSGLQQFCTHAACVCRWSLPGVWGFAAYITATNYLQAQKIVRPQVVTSAIVLALHAPINLLLIHTFGKQLTLNVFLGQGGRGGWRSL